MSKYIVQDIDRIPVDQNLHPHGVLNDPIDLPRSHTIYSDLHKGFYVFHDEKSITHNLLPCSDTFRNVSGETYSIGKSWNTSCAPCDTFPEPVKINVNGPIDFGIIPSAISYPQSLTACRAIEEFR